MDDYMIASWATDQLASVWTSPQVAEDAKTVALSVTARGIYDFIKQFFSKKPKAAIVLEQAQEDPEDQDKLQELTNQIACLLKEDQAFRNELVKLVPPQVMQLNQTVSNNSMGIQNLGNGNSFNINSPKED